MISAKSVKDRLKNYATGNGKTMQDALIAYGLERTIYRLSVSEYMDRFTLKGGIYLYALFNGDYARATRDVDFLAMSIPNNAEDMKNVFERILSMECDDALRYDLDTLEVKNITEFKEYHGVNVSAIAYLDKTRVPISIDIGFGDKVYPNREKMDFPAILDMAIPKVYAYSVYSVIAEKFEAIASLGDANSRYKDFYDIYILADRYDLDGSELKEAVKETFEHRKTGFDDIFAFSTDFVTSEIHQIRWNSFLKKKKAMINVELVDVVDMLKAVLLPIVETIKDDTEYAVWWNHKSREWKTEQKNS